MLRRDKELTAMRKFNDPRSFVANWKHPGTEHPCVYLKGRDVGERRQIVYDEAKGRCFYCGAWYGPNYGELHHLRGGLGNQRCWCIENLAWVCPRCHRTHHGHTRFGEKS